MFTIRQAQMDRFAEASRQEFDDRMVAHVQRFFPDQYQAMGDAAARRLIRHGHARANGYGIVGEADVGRYITLVFGYGRDFDENEPWAREVLADPVLTDPRTKMHCLYKAAVEHAQEAENEEAD
jgi:hypothetical protein